MSYAPTVWYMATGYGMPAGIEAHVLHYATEMRNHGFRTKVVVFKRLPGRKVEWQDDSGQNDYGIGSTEAERKHSRRHGESHRFLAALRERGIPIESLEERAVWRARIGVVLRFVPWLVAGLFREQRVSLSAYRDWVGCWSGVHELRRLLRTQKPALIHVFGRMPTKVWRELPSGRTVYHEMMTGTKDGHWTGEELVDFTSFLESAARVFAPGSGVAVNMKRDFGVSREVVPIFTMCPDEADGGEDRQNDWGSLRFGVLCRLVEQKGIRYLLEAIKAYRDRRGAVDFTFAGQGEREAMILEFVEANELEGVRVIKVQDAAEILGEMDVFVHPSLDDAMPVSIAEALMCACPCIVCAVGGVPDLVRDGQEGFVIEPRQPDQILAMMERFADMPKDEFRSFRTRARQRYEKVCRPESVGTVIADHYRAIMAETE